MLRLRSLLTFAGLASLLAARAHADDGTTLTLSATDFTFTLSRVDSSGDTTALTTDELGTFFSVARCACPTNVVAGLTLSSDASANVGTHTIDAQLMIGSDCDNVSATACQSVGGAITLSADKLATTQTISTSSIFSAAGAAGCAASTSSTRLWAIVRLDGTRLASEPSLLITLGGAGPTAPTAVKTVAADQGLLVSWTDATDVSSLLGHQVLCSPGPATASTASYDTCGASSADGGTGPFATLDPQFVCSGLVAAGTNSVRVHGLENGVTYQIAVVAVGADQTPSAPSAAVTGTPAPTYGFADLYEQHGGTAQSGCAVGSAGAPKWGGAVLVVALVLLARRRRRGLLLIVLASPLVSSTARADASDLPFSLTAPGDSAEPASPYNWDLELRFGPYRPDVDAEFADRGSAARPYQQIFGSSNRLMMQLEIDRQLVRGAGGTWAIGLGAGWFRASGAALMGDLSTPSGDTTALRLIPLSVAAVYRAEALHDRFHWPIVPYAKVGLDCTLWQMSDSSEASKDGRTFGWHAAVGLALDLTFLDPEAMREMDRESGINGAALFVEGARYDISGFGSSSALHVGDTTWFAGLKLAL